MKRLWWLWLGVALLILLGGLWGAAWAFAPRLAALSPADGSLDQPAQVAVEVRFSQPMRAESSGPPLSELLSFDPPMDGELTVDGERLTFIPSRPWPGGLTITATLQGGLRAAAWPGLAHSGLTQWHFSITQTLLAYLWPSDAQADLYALDPVSGDIRRYTDSGGVHEYDLSRDGLWIVYSADLGQGSRLLRLDRRRLAQARAAIVPPELLLDCGIDFCRNPRFSADGQQLAFERTPAGGGPGQVWLLALAGGEPRRAAAASQGSHSPAWSALGWLALYNSSLKAYQLFPPDGGQPLRVSAQAGEAGVWSPDGSLFLFPEIIEESFNTLEVTSSGRLLRLELRGRTLLGPTDLTRQNNLEDMAPVFSPAGDWIAFTRKRLATPGANAGRQLWLMQSDGTQARALTEALDYNYYDFSWSRDGQQLAFVRSDQTAPAQPPELWLINADGSSPVQLVIGGFGPRWLP